MGSIHLYIEWNLYGEIDLFHYDLRDSEVMVLWKTPILRVIQLIVYEQCKLDCIRIEYLISSKFSKLNTLKLSDEELF